MGNRRYHDENNCKIVKLGTCPRCKKENIPLTEHHVYKRAIFGPNEVIVLLCRSCHDQIEKINRTFESMCLRPHMRNYRDILRNFLAGKEIDEEYLARLVLREYKRMAVRIVRACYKEAYRKLVAGEMSEENFLKVITQEIRKTEEGSFSPWVGERIKRKGVGVVAKTKKENHGGH